MDSGAKIADGLYIGSLATARNEQCLEELGIDAIINLSGSKYENSRPQLQLVMNDSTVDIESVDMYLSKFAIGIAAIEKARAESKTVLVHCAAGINRASTLIGFYLIEQGLTYDEALSALTRANTERGVRLLTNPDFRFMLKLHDSQKRIFSARTKTFDKVSH
jgi:protein-tyrosine phosphatase